MKKIHSMLLLSIFSLSLSAQTTEGKLHELLEAYSQLGKLNGSVLIAQNGKIVLNEGYGFSDVSDSTRNNANTIFHIGSITKQFTATVILKLQEQKKLDVQDKLSKYFPDFPQGDKITIWNLLTHTSGIFNYTDDAKFMQSEVMKPKTQQQLLSVFKDKPLKFEPGVKFEYSNSNYVLLGFIIEKVTGKSYRKVMADFILKPLDMKSTGFDSTQFSSSIKAKGYTVYAKERSRESVEFDPSVSFAAGSLLSTTGDLYKWQKALLENAIITKTSFEKETTPYKDGYGYGVYVDTLLGKKLIAHGGLTFGFTSYLGAIPQDSVSVIILNNIVNYEIGDIAKDIYAVLYNQPYKLPAAVKEIVLGTAILNQYIGTYEVSTQLKIEITVEGHQLYAQATGQGKLPLSAQKEDSFFLRGTDIKVNFNKNSLGSVNELILLDGKPIPAKKIK